MLVKGLLLALSFGLVASGCTPAQGAGATEPVSASSADAPKAKLEHPPRVAAGDRFPVTIYMPKSSKAVGLKVDDTTITPVLPWSTRKGGAYVYSVILGKKGDRTLKVVQDDKTIGSAPVNVH